MKNRRFRRILGYIIGVLIIALSIHLVADKPYWQCVVAVLAVTILASGFLGIVLLLIWLLFSK